MRMVYRVLAGLIAFEVLVQAAAIAYAIFGFGKWIDDGATVDKNTFDSNSTSFHGLGGFILHGINGEETQSVDALIIQCRIERHCRRCCVHSNSPFSASFRRRPVSRKDCRGAPQPRAGDLAANLYGIILGPRRRRERSGSGLNLGDRWRAARYSSHTGQPQ